MTANFDGIKASRRLAQLGDLGATDARVPGTLARGSRTPSANAKRAILRPGRFKLVGVVHRFQDAGAGNGEVATEHQPNPIRLPNFGQPQAPVDQVLAPERFTINYQGMHCTDETGVDFLGSDEVYILTSAIHITTNGENVVRTERHPIIATVPSTYGGVDSHETRIGPVAACWSARVEEFQEGMSLTTVFMEHDEGDPDAYRDEVDGAVKLAIGVSVYLFPPAGAILALIEASGLITDLFNWFLGTGDDEIGTTTVVLGTLDELENFSRTRLSHVFVTRDGLQVDTGLEQHFQAPVSGRDYIAAYRVVRQPFAPPFPRIIE
ncbi:MAG: hypothetical protein K9L88_13680 [Chromatiaceae bacterium]|nr:hypothetical protein [Chromatiaceae bacterium]